MPAFKIAAAQIPSVRGDVDGNIETHAAAIVTAAKHGVAAVIFPELSVTGYEPDLAAELAMTPADSRLAPLLELAVRHQIDAVVGAPLRTGAAKPAIGAILIAARGFPKAYCKMHLGASEGTFFSPGDAPLAFSTCGHTVGIAICADSSQPSHPKAYAERGCAVYAAGVFLNADWHRTDSPRLAGYAACLRMLVVMANHAASVGRYASVGRSAVWAPGGTLLAEATGTDCCLVVAGRTREGWRGDVVQV